MAQLVLGQVRLQHADGVHHAKGRHHAAQGAQDDEPGAPSAFRVEVAVVGPVVLRTDVLRSDISAELLLLAVRGRVCLRQRRFMSIRGGHRRLLAGAAAVDETRLSLISM